MMAKEAAVSRYSLSDKVGSGSCGCHCHHHWAGLNLLLRLLGHCSTGDHVGDKWSIGQDWPLGSSDDADSDLMLVENETWVRKCTHRFFFGLTRPQNWRLDFQDDDDDGVYRRAKWPKRRVRNASWRGSHRQARSIHRWPPHHLKCGIWRLFFKEVSQIHKLKKTKIAK